MLETTTVYSLHVRQQYKVRGNLKHHYAPAGCIRWLIYLIDDTCCSVQYIGSTIDNLKRWRDHKSDCNSTLKTDGRKKLTYIEISKKTALCRHFINGCRGNIDKGKSNLSITLVDFYDTSKLKSALAGHKSSAGCRCTECNNLKKVESTWIYKMGTIFRPHGLNSRDGLEMTN